MIKLLLSLLVHHRPILGFTLHSRSFFLHFTACMPKTMLAYKRFIKPFSAVALSRFASFTCFYTCLINNPVKIHRSSTHCTQPHTHHFAHMYKPNGCYHKCDKIITMCTTRYSGVEELPEKEKKTEPKLKKRCVHTQKKSGHINLH